MTTLLAIFLLALILGLVLTPLAEKLGRALGIMDDPGERKVHISPIPRTGGPAVCVALLLALGAARIWGTDISRLLVLDRSMLCFGLGAMIALGLGLFDDIRRLDAWRKLPLQILAASVAFLGGVNLDVFTLFGLELTFGPFPSYVFTVLWFLVFMNALNLMDGLDGLAGGIVFFASLVMIVLSIPRADYLTAMFFAATAGAVLGFLRSNFSPATIFLGDSGTYFLGYAVAGFGLIASVKSQVGAAILIPVLAMGLPLLDTLLAVLRRLALRHGIFKPDGDHIHHRLLKMGMETRQAVALLHGVTVVLCFLAIALVMLRDEQSGLILVLIGAGAFIFAGRLGYLETLRLRCIPGWDDEVLQRIAGTGDELGKVRPCTCEKVGSARASGSGMRTVAGQIRTEAECSYVREGKIEGARTIILNQAIAKFGHLPVGISKKLHAIDDIDTLNALSISLLRAETLEVFESLMDKSMKPTSQ